MSDIGMMYQATKSGYGGYANMFLLQKHMQNVEKQRQHADLHSMGGIELGYDLEDVGSIKSDEEPPDMGSDNLSPSNRVPRSSIVATSNFANYKCDFGDGGKPGGIYASDLSPPLRSRQM